MDIWELLKFEAEKNTCSDMILTWIILYLLNRHNSDQYEKIRSRIVRSTRL
jgi:hypothetical protein